MMMPFVVALSLRLTKWKCKSLEWNGWAKRDLRTAYRQWKAWAPCLSMPSYVYTGAATRFSPSLTECCCFSLCNKSGCVGDNIFLCYGWLTVCCHSILQWIWFELELMWRLKKIDASKTSVKSLTLSYVFFRCLFWCAWRFYHRKFMEFAKVLCEALRRKGHWADYIDPCSGLPVCLFTSNCFLQVVNQHTDADAGN